MSGSGNFVTVSENHVALDDMAEEIATTIAYTREYADRFYNTLSLSIANITASVADYNPNISNTEIPVPSISGPSFPLKPTFASLNLDNNWPDTLISDPTIQDYGLIDFQFVTPTAPAEIESAFSFNGDAYTSEMWQAVFSTVHTAILNGDYGLDPVSHAALVAKEQEARRRNQDKEFQSLMKAVGTTGWNLSGGHTQIALADFHVEIIKRDQDALNTITVQDFQIANENKKFFIGTAKDLETILRATYESAQTRGLEAAKAVSEYVARFKAENIKLYLAKWEGVKNSLEALKLKIDAISTRNNSEVQVFLGRAQVLTAKVAAISAKNQSMVDARKGEIEVYATEVNAVKEQYSALIEEVRLNQEAVKIEIDRELRIEGFNLEAFTEKAKLASTMGLGVANIAAQGIASALGCINTSLSNSYSGSEQRGEQWGHSDSISESRNFEEEGA